MNKLTAVGWLVNKLMKESTGYISLDALSSYTEQALEMETKQIHETKQYWFGRGILAGRENRIAELKPKK